MEYVKNLKSQKHFFFAISTSVLIFLYLNLILGLNLISGEINSFIHLAKNIGQYLPQIRMFHHN